VLALLAPGNRAVVHARLHRRRLRAVALRELRQLLTHRSKEAPAPSGASVPPRHLAAEAHEERGTIVAYLVAGLILVGAVASLNLLLTLGVIRRLRELDAQLPQRGLDSTLLPAGATVDDFAADTTDGATVSRRALRGDTVVGFFSPGCEPCEALQPAFVEYAARVPGGRDHVIAVVAGSPDEAAPVVARLSGIARVVVEEAAGGAVVRAFRVRAYPALFHLDGTGEVRASGRNLDALPVATSSS
jgi:thiol-disulfide isomerase/thioredoxin